MTRRSVLLRLAVVWGAATAFSALALLARSIYNVHDTWVVDDVLYVIKLTMRTQAGPVLWTDPSSSVALWVIGAIWLGVIVHPLFLPHTRCSRGIAYIAIASWHLVAVWVFAPWRFA